MFDSSLLFCSSKITIVTMTNSTGYSKETPDVLYIILKVTEKIQKMFVEARRPHSQHVFISTTYVLELPIYFCRYHISYIECLSDKGEEFIINPETKQEAKISCYQPRQTTFIFYYNTILESCNKCDFGVICPHERDTPVQNLLNLILCQQNTGQCPTEISAWR